MYRIRIKNFLIDNKNQQPLLILQTRNRKPRKTISVGLNILDLPKILSALYKIKEDEYDIHHTFSRLIAGTPFLRMDRIVMTTEENYPCELHFRVLFLVKKKMQISLTDGLILALVTGLPLYARPGLFRHGKKFPDTPKFEETYPKNILEKWDPHKANVRLN